MNRRIKVATVIGALLAATLLLIERGPADASGNAGVQARSACVIPSPFDRRMRYSRI
ncbi:hypothetical protein [Paraburkholderia rhizosphaerae]|uniref:hypothetical protein n=1 Tax=Paraburkholderia rhizosphaerae TaxID=480658 RepID=UPI001416F4E9|nr:hypothetical protein [Paraburkholderia rhizosphaerae]